MTREFGRRAVLVGSTALATGCTKSSPLDSQQPSGSLVSLENGWKHEYHEDEGESVSYSDGKVFSGSKDGTVVAVYADGQPLWKKDVHERFPKRLVTTEFTRDLYATNEALFSAGRNGEVIAMDPENGAEIWRHTHHNDSVWEVHEAEGTVYSSGRDAKVVAADASDGSFLWEHTAHHVDGNPSNEMIRTIHHSDGTVYSAGFDGQIIATNGDNGEILWKHAFGHSIKSVHQSDETLFFAPWSHDVREDVIGLDEETLTQTISHDHHNEDAEGYRSPHTGVEELYIADELVYSAGDDGTLVAASVSDLSLLNMHERHDASVRSVSADGDSVYTTARDGAVIKWAFDTDK